MYTVQLLYYVVMVWIIGMSMLSWSFYQVFWVEGYGHFGEEYGDIICMQE